MDPFVTIVIPVWDDHVALLPRCLAAIERETVPARLIIVDNASSVPIPTHDSAVVLRLPGRATIGHARNAGLDDVSTRYVVFADADDELAPGSLQRSIALLERSPSAVGVIGRSTVDEHGRYRRGRTPSRAFLTASRFAPRVAPLFWLYTFQASITTTVLRTSSVSDAGAFPDADIGEDWQLAARLARRGRLICLNDPVRIYHRHAGAARTTRLRATAKDIAASTIRKDCMTDPCATRPQRFAASLLDKALRAS